MGLIWSIGRPCMFALAPETAHRAAGTLLRAPLPWAAIAGTPDPHPVEFAGIQLANPVGLAAGFDKSAAMADGLARLGFGYLVIGTVTRQPRVGNAKPRIARIPGERALVNSMGIPNDGVERVAARLEKRRSSTPIFASIADEEPDDVLEVHARLAPLVQAFELNVSSPNSPWRHSGRDNEAYLKDVLVKIGGAGPPLFVKIPPFTEEHGSSLQLVRIAADNGAMGITCANTRPVVSAGLAKGAGGLSGAPLTAEVPRMVAAVKAAAPDAPVNACGGIFTAADAQRCLDAGATTVQLYTGLIYEGPTIVTDICRGLRKW